MNYIKTTLLAAIIGLMPIVPANAQSDKVLKEKNPEFFKTEEARRIGDQLLIWQRNTGGWPKNVDMVTPLSNQQREVIIKDKQVTDDSTIDNGATTIWETWDGVRSDGTVHDSLNHYSYGAVIGWLFHGVCGIRLSAGKLVIEPQPGQELGFAKAKWKSPVGEIRSSWKYCGNTLMFDICVPIPATILLPNGETFAVKEGEHHYEILL